ncbi:MAG TPA: zf-HC2 domain-containing protein [Acidobacteriota bacterium]|nr:zf-HC2 domain-containing protein [Acidobacteriota bacterium]
MTTRPDCREIERLIVDGEGGELGTIERRLVDDHVRECGRCRAYAADHDLIRREIASGPWPALPAALDRRIERAIRTGGTAAPAGAEPTALPAWVLAALAVVTIITGVWLAVSLANVAPETKLADLPVAGLAAVIVIAQNALMLFFAPVVLRTFRARREGSQSAG